MPQRAPRTNRTQTKQRLLNQTFYRFVYSFIAVVAAGLLFILFVGIGSGVQ